MKWVKASEKLPASNGDIIWRFIGQTNKVGCSYKAMFGFLLPYVIDGYKNYEEIEWLDEATEAVIQKAVN